MRPPTSRDRIRFEMVAALILIASVALGDEPSTRPGPVGRVTGQVVPLDVPDGFINRPRNPWLGQTVVLKSLKTDLRIEHKSVPMPAGRVFHKFAVKKVEPREKGEWLWLVDESLKGWVDAGEVVPEDEAHAYFSDLIRRIPGSAEAFYLRGSLGKGDALADLTEAIRLDPKLAIAFVARAEVYSSKEEKGKALADLTEAIRLDPKLAIAYFQRASLSDGPNDWEHAIPDLSEAIRLNPGDGMAYSIRGVGYHQNKDWEHAISDLTEAIRLTPTGDEFSVSFAMLNLFHHVRGEAYNKRNDYDRAIADFSEAIRLTEARTILRDEGLIVASLWSRADAYDSKKDYDRAIAGFTEAIARSPKQQFTSVCLASRALVRRHARDVDGALADYAEALRLDPPPVVAAVSYLNRGQIESDRDDAESALADLAKAVAVLPTESSVYVVRAHVLNDHGRHDRALADCDLAAEMAPKDAWGHDYRAWIRATCPDPKFRDGKKAVEGATRACGLTGWKQAYCLETLAAAQAEAGDFDAAVRWQARALDLVTDDEARARLRERLELFGKKQPYRDVRPPSGDRRAGHELPEIPLTVR